LPEENDQDQINKIKEVAIHSIDSTEQRKAIDTLVPFGNKAISAITDIIDSNIDDQVKTYGYEAIQKIKTHPIL
jgi:hypothetical protein